MKNEKIVAFFFAVSCFWNFISFSTFTANHKNLSELERLVFLNWGPFTLFCYFFILALIHFSLTEESRKSTILSKQAALSSIVTFAFSILFFVVILIRVTFRV